MPMEAFRRAKTEISTSSSVKCESFAFVFFVSLITVMIKCCIMNVSTRSYSKYFYLKVMADYAKLFVSMHRTVEKIMVTP